MTIQLNTVKNLSVHKAYGKKLETLNLTRLEVHLSDENGFKNGINDKRRPLEARLKGRHPISVTGLANTYALAVESAIDKLKATLDTILGRIRSHQRSKIILLLK